MSATVDPCARTDRLEQRARQVLRKAWLRDGWAWELQGLSFSGAQRMAFRLEGERPGSSRLDHIEDL